MKDYHLVCCAVPICLNKEQAVVKQPSGMLFVEDGVFDITIKSPYYGYYCKLHSDRATVPSNAVNIRNEKDMVTFDLVDSDQHTKIEFKFQDYSPIVTTVHNLFKLLREDLDRPLKETDKDLSNRSINNLLETHKQLLKLVDLNVSLVDQVADEIAKRVLKADLVDLKNGVCRIGIETRHRSFSAIIYKDVGRIIK